MKRTPLERKTPLVSKSKLESSKLLTRTKPMPKKRAKPRKGPPRDPKFLAFVRSQPCYILGCFEKAEAHHFGRRGKSQRCSDYETVPLCHDHHMAWHSSTGLPGKTRAEWKELWAAYAVELRAQFEGHRDEQTF